MATKIQTEMVKHPEYKCQSKTVKLSYFTLEKFLTNIFFIHINVGYCCEGSPKNNENPVAYWEHCIWWCFFSLFSLSLLSFGRRVHFRGQKSTFWSNHPEYNFLPKTVKLSYFTLEKSFFSIFNQIFFHSYQSCPLLRGVTKKMREPSHLLGTWYLAVFQKKLGTKLFIFRVKNFFHIIFFSLCFGPKVHFRGQKSTFWSNHPE
jgi:hypothetical protein